MLISKATHGEHLEMLLNQPGSINNLDLDGDGYPDHIHVAEYGDGNDFRGFSLYVFLGETSKQEVGRIEFNRQFGGGVIMQITGNEQIYGHGYYRFKRLGGMTPFLVWAFMPSRVVYVSQYHYGYYPAGIVRVRVVPGSVYRTRTVKVVKESNVVFELVRKPVIQSTVESPNKGAVAPEVKAKLANPTETQKQFQVEKKKNPLVTTGFGKDKNPATVPETASKGEVKPGTLAKPAVPGAGKVGDAETTEKQFKVTEDKKPLDTKGFSKPKEPVVTTEKLPAPKIITPAPSVPSVPAPAPKPFASAPKSPSGRK